MKPKGKTPKRKTGSRRSHHALKPINLRKDEDGNVHLPHHATAKTGTYRGRSVSDQTKKAVKAVKKASK